MTSVSFRSRSQVDFTEEQDGIIDAVKAGKNVRAIARAGAGKSTCLVGCAARRPFRMHKVLAFNAKIAEEARRRFPGNTQALTIHSEALRCVGEHLRHRINTKPTVTPWDAAKMIGLPKRLNVGEFSFPDYILYAITREAYEAWCLSDAATPVKSHVPRAPGMPDKDHADLASVILPAIDRLWDEQCDPNGPSWFSQSTYLKMWGMSEPKIDAQTLLIDEAQDLDPLVIAVIKHQDMQIVTVGDPEQAIYAWRGAVDALERVPADVTLYITQSFRFGDRIANAANSVLDILGATPLVRGTPTIASELRSMTDEEADITLYRSNSAMLARTVDLMAEGKKVHVIGRTREVKDFAFEAQKLKDGKPSKHPLLMGFTSWEQVMRRVKETDKGELQLMVHLVNRHGANRLGAILLEAEQTPRAGADVVLSTAHQSKGLEFDKVRLGDDFPCSSPDDPDERAASDEELRLLYVAVTRAKCALDTNDHDDLPLI